MPSPAERFLDTAVSPFADNAELQIHARRELEEQIDASAAGDLFWAEAANRLRLHDKSWWARRWRWVVGAGATLAILACLGTGMDLIQGLRIGGCFSTLPPQVPHLPEPEAPEITRWLGKGLSSEQKFVLLGDTSKPVPWEQLAALSQRYPDNLSYYAQYAVAHYYRHATLPPDFLTTAARLDPDNGWFPLAAAQAAAHKAKANRVYSPRRKGSPPTPDFAMKDPFAFQEALDLLAQAAQRPRHDSYQAARQAEVSALLPRTTDYPALLRRISVSESVIQSSYLGGAYLGNAVMAQANILATRGDRPGFRELLIQWRSTVLQDNQSLLTLEHASQQLAYLIQTADRLGMPAEAGKLREVSQLIILAKRKPEHTHAESLVRGSVARGYPGWNIANGNSIPTGDPTPGRLADHAVGGWVAAVGIATGLLVLASAFAACRFRHGTLPRRLSARMTALLHPTDLMWLLGAGCLAPVLGQQLLYHVTPLGGREWSYAVRGGVVWGEIYAWIALLVTAPLFVLQWRLKKRLPMAGIASKWTSPGYVALAAAVLAMPVTGLGFVMEGPSTWQTAGVILIAIPALWWLLHLLVALCSRHHALGSLTFIRLVVPAYFFSATLLFLLGPVYRAQERYWVSRDKVVANPPIQAIDETLEKQRSQRFEILAPLSDLR
ncbi:hypothetical protein [Luteolibacter sp. LG18]|uniref:hypothetical protein n=1 Tax=Luteolibacter sp. LG18 TaxID=2819286 RepID=UPI002B2BCB16|nr:hypothetical protein llg_19780 [Luteolibacter sp. LG18]